MQIIAFGYKKETGKNTAAQFLTTALKTNCPGTKIRRESFAAKLKDICCQLYGWADLEPGPFYEFHRELKEVVLPLIGRTPREIWIDVGNALRDVYPDTWVKSVLTKTEHDFKIITDLRFWHEAETIQAAGGILIRMDRDVPRGTDPAEVELDPWQTWNYVVDNTGNLNYLNNQIITIAEQLCQKKKES